MNYWQNFIAYSVHIYIHVHCIYIQGRERDINKKMLIIQKRLQQAIYKITKNYIF